MIGKNFQDKIYQFILTLTNSDTLSNYDKVWSIGATISVKTTMKVGFRKNKAVFGTGEKQNQLQLKEPTFPRKDNTLV